MRSDPNDYSIYHIDQEGRLVGKLDDTDGRAACCIESADNIGAILKTDTINSALAQMTTEYVEHFLTAWFLIEAQNKGEDLEERQKKVTLEFLEMFLIFHQFPALYLSDRLRHLDVIGACERLSSETIFRLFTQRLLLNGVVGRKLTRFRCSLAS